MGQHSTISSQIECMVKSALELDPQFALASTEDLSTYGFDSLRSVELIVDLEEHFDIEFDDEELLFNNFSTIDKIVEMVSNKLHVKDAI